MLFNVMAFRNVKKAVYLPSTFSHYRKDNESSITHSYKFDLADMWAKQYKMIEKQLEIQEKPLIYFDALSNRIALGLIGLGLSLIGDTSLSIFQKKKELGRLLSMQQYEQSLDRLDFSYFPTHWKFFFCLAKQKKIYMLLFLLTAMNRLRKL